MEEQKKYANDVRDSSRFLVLKYKSLRAIYVSTMAAGALATTGTR